MQTETSEFPRGQIVHETKADYCDPTALGVFGLAIVTLVASSAKLHWTNGSSFLIPWALFLGAGAQLWASMVDFKRNNIYGATVLGVYGLFWAAVALQWAIKSGWLGGSTADADPRQFALACFGYAVFSLFILVAACEINKVFALIMLFINLLLPSLGLALMGIKPEWFNPVAAWSEFVISLLGFYASGATFLNSFFGRVILPLGKPLGLIKKYAL